MVSRPQELLDPGVYVDLRRAVARPLVLKCEGLNFSGSLKMRTADGMVAAAERSGRLRAGCTLIESSSGNLGLALSMIAASRGIGFVCVVDPRCNGATVRMMRALGTDVVRVDEPDPHGGYLGSRLRYVRERCEADPDLVWLNQYENEANQDAHRQTAAGIVRDLGAPDVLFVGTGTGGTVMGCVRHLRDHGLATRVVAVDAEGSVTFGGPASRRLLPGLGASVVPPLVVPELLDDVVHVSELQAVRTCRALAADGLLLGGSTGTVVAGALRWLGTHDPDARLNAVAVSPDLGERYVDTIYDDAWALEHFGPAALEPLPLRDARDEVAAVERRRAAPRHDERRRTA